MRVSLRRAPRGAILLALTAILMAAFLVLASSTEAAPGGKGKGGGKGGGSDSTSSASSASLALQSASATLSANGQSYGITGSGFAPNSIVYLSIHEPTCCGATSVGTDANGNFWFSRSTEGPGTYTVNASVLKRNKVVLVASISFAVVEQ